VFFQSECAVCFRQQQQTKEMVKKNFAAASQHRLRFLWINLIALLAHIGFSSADYGKFFPF
jgi:hypothetical protein